MCEAHWLSATLAWSFRLTLAFAQMNFFYSVTAPHPHPPEQLYQEIWKYSLSESQQREKGTSVCVGFDLHSLHSFLKLQDASGWQSKQEA